MTSMTDLPIPDDGLLHNWTYAGKKYLRNFDNELWLQTDDCQLGDWQGVYLPTEDRIDDTVPEPAFDDTVSEPVFEGCDNKIEDVKKEKEMCKEKRKKESRWDKRERDERGKRKS